MEVVHQMPKAECVKLKRKLFLCTNNKDYHGLFTKGKIAGEKHAAKASSELFLHSRSSV